jgi:hypothetical protein
LPGYFHRDHLFCGRVGHVGDGRSFCLAVDRRGAGIPRLLESVDLGADGEGLGSEQGDDAVLGVRHEHAAAERATHVLDRSRTGRRPDAGDDAPVLEVEGDDVALEVGSDEDDRDALRGRSERGPPERERERDRRACDEELASVHLL